MNAEIIVEKLETFLGETGTLHDVRFQKIEFDVGSRSLILSTENLFACAPSHVYPDPVPGKLVFHGLHDVRLNLNLSEGVRISVHEIKEGASHFWAGIFLNEGAGVYPPAHPIEIEFEKLSVFVRERDRTMFCEFFNV